MSETTSTAAGYLQIPTENADATLLGVLALNLNNEVVAELDTGDGHIVYKAGVLYAVGADYLALYDDVNLTNILVPTPMLRFVTFYQSGTRPITEGDTSATAVQPGIEARTSTYGIQPVSTHTRAHAAFNYARRKAHKLE